MTVSEIKKMAHLLHQIETMPSPLLRKWLSDYVVQEAGPHITAALYEAIAVPMEDAR